ncbi:unnamed protein product, partial [Porites evermanni]
MPMPVSSSTPLAQKNEKVISIQKSTDKKKLHPNRLAAVREHTERMFPNEVNWPTIKKAIDEKCRMVRNNRCTL